MESSTMNESTPRDTVKRAAFEFRGDGMEYFKIWIVNILLTIITLGIYSAWAHVKNKRYFYSNLYLDDNNFRYLAEPLQILKSRIIAVIALIVFAGVWSVNVIVGVVLNIALLFAIPYFINQSMAFNCRMSAYKNIQFRFKATYLQAFMAVYVWQLLAVLTLGILYPYALLKLNEYSVNNSRYGTTSFSFKASFKDYAIIFLTMIGVGIVFGLPLWGLTLLVPAASALTPLVMVVVYFGLITFFIVSVTNLFYRSLSLADHRFNASLDMPSLAKVILINILLIIITFGLYAPAAKVRMVKYMASRITMDIDGSLDGFIAAEEQNVSALGDEMGQVFDFGI